MEGTDSTLTDVLVLVPGVLLYLAHALLPTRSDCFMAIYSRAYFTQSTMDKSPTYVPAKELVSTVIITQSRVHVVGSVMKVHPGAA